MIKVKKLGRACKESPTFAFNSQVPIYLLLYNKLLKNIISYTVQIQVNVTGNYTPRKSNFFRKLFLFLFFSITFQI